MAALTSVTLDVPDAEAAEAFYAAAWDLQGHVGVRAAEPATSGFRGFTLSLVVSQPGNVDLLVGAAIERGATVLKPVEKSFWGYGGTLQAPDGAIWKIATSSKKDAGPATTEIDDVVLLLGVADVKESKRFYVDHGLTVKRSFGSKYVEFDAAPSELKLALYGRRALAKDAGVPPDGSGSHRLSIHSDAGSFTDPDGFAWEAAGPA
jgi:predicted lactoylglutathione lyase